jgi:hypothetical protein
LLSSSSRSSHYLSTNPGMFPCDICQRTDFCSARGLAIHISRIHRNRPSTATHPHLIDDFPSDEEGKITGTYYQRDLSPEQTNPGVQIRYDQPSEIPNHPPVQRDSSPMGFQKSAATVTQVTHTVHYPHRCLTAAQGPKLQQPWECPGWQPWKPFQTSEDYDLAYAYWRDGSTKTHINYVLERGLDGDAVQFKNADELQYLWRRTHIYHALPPVISNPMRFRFSTWHEHTIPDVGTIYYRDIIECVKLLLRHPPFRDSLIYSPIRQYNSFDERVYGDLHSADWWWRVQEGLPQGSTIIPIICASDKAHLTNFSGDKSIWPLYMTIGNIPKDIWRERSKRAWICIGLLPTTKIDQVESRMQWHAAVHHILRPLRTPDPLSLACSDGLTRKCYLILNGWVADWPEQCTVALVKQNRCPVCETPTAEFGDPRPHDGWHQRDPADYMSDDEPIQRSRRSQYSASGPASPNAVLTAKEKRTIAGILPRVNEFEEYPNCSPYSLWRFDWLHVCALGIVKSHLMDWLVHCMEEWGLKDKWEAFLQRVPPYPELMVLNKRYSHVQQWQGKDIRHLLRYLLVSLTPLLKPPNERRHSQEQVRVLLATRRLLEVVILAQQRYHTESSLQTIDEALSAFHALKYVFLPARKRPDFNFPKLHLLSHLTDHVRQHGSCDSWTTDVSEGLHMSLKDAYRATNRVNFIPQLLAYLDADMGMSMMRLSLKHLALNGFYVQESARILDLLPPPIKLLNTRRARQKRQNNPTAPRWIDCQPHVPSGEPHLRPHLTALTTDCQDRVILQDADTKLQCHGLKRLFEKLLDDIFPCNWLQQYFEDRERFCNEVILRRANKIKFTTCTFQEPNKPQSVYVKCHSGSASSKRVVHPLWIRTSSSTNDDTFQGRTIGHPILFCAWIVPRWLTQPPHAPTTFARFLQLPMFRQHRQHGWIMEFMVCDVYEYATISGLPDASTGFVTVRKAPHGRRACDIQCIEGPVHLVPAHLRTTPTLWNVNNHIDVETYWYVY